MIVYSKFTHFIFTYLFLLTIAPIIESYGQGNFEGKIVYTISYSNLPPEMKSYESMLPKDMTIYIKGNKSRMEQSQMMGKNIVVSDMDEKIGFIEMEVSSQKFRLNMSTEDFDEDQESIPSNIEYFNDSKNILGYDCKKATMKNDKGDISMTVYFTEKIKNQAQKEFMGLKGFPLQYKMAQQSMTVEMMASEISEQTVPNSLFDKSDGYKDISESDLQNMMGGGKL